MPASINNSPVKDLLKKEIQQYLQVELDNFHNLLLGSLARISCLEKEIDQLKKAGRGSHSKCTKRHIINYLESTQAKV